ncbi:MAG: selenium metabolism-associated LysR family transcriptional regulator [Defluviitaleaceae bacterium]|nr:selenium metabolism-associated LysR family transcriptional regulator [Defluviitaleaceae bacterium]
MDFKQIEAYVKVVELASFSKTAEAIFMSQPSVSAYINALEKNLGVVLINRREVTPTPAGKIFYESAKELLTLKTNTVERIKNLSGNLCGEINILASTVPAQYILPELLTVFAKTYPQITFSVKQADTLDVCRGVAMQKAEIGFAGGIAEAEKCEFTEFMTEEMVLIAPPGEDFCPSREYSLDEILNNYPFISREKGSGTRLQYDSFLTSLDLSIKKPRAYFDNTQSIINAVINGLGVSIVSEFAARDFISHKMLKSVKLKNKLPKRKFYYVLKKNFIHSHLVELFAAFINSSI